MKPTLQEILCAGYEAFERTHPLPGYVRRAARAIINCRTDAMGGHIEICPKGDFERTFYHSCRHRSCPKCSYMQIEQWLTNKKELMLRCTHYHTIFTMPDSLNEVWLQNVKLINDTFIKCAKDALFELLKDRKYMGATPGVVVDLQSWSQELLPHLHTHFIITGGGLTNDGRWVSPKKGCLLPRKVLMIKFRAKMRYSLIKLTQEGKLKLPSGISTQKLINLLNKLGRKSWNVKILPPYDYADGVVIYLGRYLKGGPMKESRLISFDGQEVTFQCRGTKIQPNRKKLTLSINDFIRRILLHIPVPGAQNVRSFGLYANACREKLNQARALIGQKALKKPKILRWQDIIKRFTGKEPIRCPLCGNLLIRTPILVYSHSPPRNAMAIQYIKMEPANEYAS
jgi:hypothetical protein